MVSTAKLFTPLTLGGKTNVLQLQHRVVMAPLTRLRTGEAGVSGELAVQYYSQRASEGGLQITEGTYISATARGYFGAPGVFRDDQVEGWKRVTQAVHAKGGKIFCQLWHTGRVSHPMNQPDEQLPVSASAVGMDEVKSSAVTREGRKKYVVPRALETDEIPLIVEDYKRAAQNAFAAGFDGVELHAANGYLLEQFLCDGVNKRTDKYGGSVENRARFIFEALDAVLSVAESSRVGVRLSPYGLTFGCTDSDPANTYSYVVKKLNDEYDLAYLHIVEPRGHHFTSDKVPKEGVTKHFRALYDGVLLTAGGYDRDEALATVDNEVADMVAFGRNFIATPDLVKRIKTNAPLNEWNQKTFYWSVGENDLSKGYTDYPLLEDTDYYHSQQAASANP